MRLTSKPLAVLVVALFFGGIVFSSALGWWQTEGGRQSRSAGEGEPAGKSAPGEGYGAESAIKGRTTFAEVLAWGVAEETIEEILGVPLPAARGMTVKDFCQAQGLEFGVVKAKLQEAVEAAGK